MNNKLQQLVVAGISGIIFGFGLAIAGMTNPGKIQNFLDIAAIPSGGWDPSLIFVMGSGVVVGLVGLRLHRFMSTPISVSEFRFPTNFKIDRQLVVGSAIFGVGWGLSGFCPGPAIANLGIVPGAVIPFVLAMFAGSWIAGAVLSRNSVGQAAVAGSKLNA